MNLITKINRLIKDLENKIGKRLVHNLVTIEGFVEITNGDVHIRSKNSVVDQGLVGLINYLSASSITSGHCASTGWTSMSNSWIVVGTNTGTGTNHGTNANTSPIGTTPGTKPNTQTGATSNPGSGQWQVQWTATWNPGTVSGTLGEVALYLYIDGDAINSFGGTVSQNSLLFSRMASADGKFSSFSINTAVPLSVAWTFLVTYAT